MSITYLDTSALVKRYVDEPGSEALNDAWTSFSIIGSAIIIRVEIASALAKAKRLGWIDDDGSRRAWQAFLDDWERLTLVNISIPVIHRASQLAWDYTLRGYDAVHLAAALTWQEGLSEAVQLCTFDQRLWSAVKQVNMLVWPENLDEYNQRIV